MTIYDISLLISPNMPLWPGDPPVTMKKLSSIDAGAHANVSSLECSVHTGTHVDAPHHFLNDNRTIEYLPLDVLTGQALVVGVPDEVDHISAQVIQEMGIPGGTSRILFKTRNSAYWKQAVTEFKSSFVAISEDGAEWLVKRGVQLVGVDYLSVAPYSRSTPTHRCLLQGGVVIVEGLDLSRIEPGEYTLYCLPLKLSGADGAPARAILTDE